MQQLTPLDSLFYHMETPNQPMVIGGLWICDQSQVEGGVIRHKQILEYIEDKINITPMFRRRLQEAPLSLDDPYWLEDENFDLEYHVRHVGLPQPGDWRQLCIFTSRLMSRSIDKNRAPWELYIIEGLNNMEGVPENSFAVLLRLHHAYADGKSGVVLSTALLENSPSHAFSRRDNIQYVERAPTKVEMWSRTAPRLLTQGFRSIKAGYSVASKGVKLFSRLRGDSRPDQGSAPTTIFNVPVSPHRTYGVVNWKAQELIPMRKLVEGASLNDVLISIISGGIRRYLSKHSALPDNQSLIAMCPVAVRPEAAKAAVGNMVSTMYIAIGTDIEDPQERLELILQRTKRGVPLARDLVADISTDVLEMLPPYVRKATFWGLNKVSGAAITPFNTIITNVPGPVGMDKNYFVGAEVMNGFPLVPISNGVAVSHGISGLYDNINLGVLADRAVIEDMDFYIECMEQSTEEFRQALQAHVAKQKADTEAKAINADEKATAATMSKTKAATKPKSKTARKAKVETATKPAVKKATKTAVKPTVKAAVKPTINEVTRTVTDTKPASAPETTTKKAG